MSTTPSPHAIVARAIADRRAAVVGHGRHLLLAIAASVVGPFVIYQALALAGMPTERCAGLGTAMITVAASLLLWSYAALRAVVFAARATQLYSLSRRARVGNVPRARALDARGDW